ncbi:hypothetical protein Tco_1440742 [Tanacetum coccineum]
MSSKFSMKDMGEADDCSPVSTPMDPVEKIKPNTGKPVDQLEYSRAIGCLMYAMTSTRPDIAYAVGRLSSAPTMAKAYSQIYNGKSRHLGVRHSMIRVLIMNGVISIEFVRSQKNLADHLTKGLARDLVNKCKTKRITYVNMKFCRFKKLGLGFLVIDGHLGTDIAKIPRKRSKTGKHEHGNGRARKKLKAVSQRIKRHPSPLIGGNPRREDTWISEVTQGKGYFALIIHSEETQEATNHGLPRWQSV